MSCPFAGDFCAGVSPVLGYVGLLPAVSECEVRSDTYHTV